MIHAINKGKTSIELKEDTKTSMILGSLLHLPTTIFWQILRRACKDEQILPRICGKINSIEFWPEWSIQGEYNNKITNSNRVEPDVFISFEDFDLIIEVKLYDGNGQYEEQWCNEINSYHNEYGENKKLYFIALGGNENLNFGRNSNIEIIKCSWVNLMIEVETCKNEIVEHKYNLGIEDSLLRILQDLIDIFNYFGVVDSWLENIDFKKYKIDLYNIL
ncbi:MAG: hypothetical protein KAZ28_02120 [Bacteroidaceae bacterium]|nr:hypothetical protein [Bacteroidaceae bacterium]